MKKLIIGLVIGICLPLVGGYVFLISGGMPVATKGKALPMEKFVARTAIHAAMKGEEDKPSPVTADEINLMAGAKIYMNNCAVCHGGFAGKPTNIALGLFPKPPQLLEPDHGVTDDPVGESYWKVKNGIRLTGMPGFVDTLSETEMWQVSQLLVQADKLSEAVKEALKFKAQ
jgi:thiosulfate dehydrogenase